MSARSAWAAVSATLNAKGFAEQQGSVPEFHGKLNVHGSPVDVAVEIPDLTFQQLPIVKLLNRTQLAPAVVGHVFRYSDNESGICYAADVGLPLDLHNPGGSILRVLEEAKGALEVNFAGRGTAEVRSEYQEYWRGLAGKIRMFASKQPTGRSLEALTLSHCTPESGQAFLAIHDGEELAGHETKRLGPALLIQTDREIGPAPQCMVPDSWAQLNSWFSSQPGLAGEDWKRVEAVLFQEGMVCISAPNAIVAVRSQLPPVVRVGLSSGKIRPHKVKKLIGAKTESIGIERYTGVWCSLRSLAERNLVGLDTLAETKIALIGCGTIGSHLAKLLVQSGAGALAPLIIVDRQLLTHGNVGRHYLGTSHIDAPKSSAMREELLRFHPLADVRSYMGEYAEFWSEISGADLIIDATGEWNTQYGLNDRFHSDQSAAQAILHVWVSGNGAAVQTLLNSRDDEFCLRCLTPKMGEPTRYPALKPGIEANVADATCGDGAFYPYPVAAPAIAAGLACEVALAWRNGHPGGRLRTMVLDHERGIERKPTTPTGHKDCPACRARVADA